MKTKKLQPVLLLIIAIVLLLALPNRAQAYMLYENPQRIILSAPANNYTTANANVSILGACDWTQPLYMNMVSSLSMSVCNPARTHLTSANQTATPAASLSNAKAALPAAAAPAVHSAGSASPGMKRRFGAR